MSTVKSSTASLSSTPRAPATPTPSKALGPTNQSTYKTDPETGEVKRVKRGLIETAEDQVKAVRATGTDTPIQWHIAEKYTFDALRDKQDWGEFSAEIELFYTPPN